MGSVIKHIPGHGASTLDSHLKTPRVNLSLKELIKRIFFLSNQIILYLL